MRPPVIASLLCAAVSCIFLSYGARAEFLSERELKKIGDMHACTDIYKEQISVGECRRPHWIISGPSKHDVIFWKDEYKYMGSPLQTDALEISTTYNMFSWMEDILFDTAKSGRHYYILKQNQPKTRAIYAPEGKGFCVKKYLDRSKLENNKPIYLLKHSIKFYQVIDKKPIEESSVSDCTFYFLSRD